MTYDAYGNPTTEGKTSSLGYDGEYTGVNTGLIYLGARELDPGTAQFVTTDPFQAISGAPFNYRKDNPINDSDPSGLLSGACGFETGGLLGVAGTVIKTIPFERAFRILVAVQGTAGNGAGIAGLLEGSCQDGVTA